MACDNAEEIQPKIREINALAQQIEAAPNFGPDYWTMQEIDAKCQRIRQLCSELSALVGTGTARPGGGYPNTGRQ
jgi:hypothetical protein